MKTYAIITTSTSLVTNIIVWDGESSWHPPEGCIAVLMPPGQSVSPGWSYVDGVFIAQPEEVI